jgi:transketolase
MNETITNAAEDVKKIRLDILRMVNVSNEGHLPSSFSIVELLYAIYANMKKEDAFFLSKGHASAAFFATLAHFNIIDHEMLFAYCAYESKLGGHPHRTVPGVMNSSGSLGHGFPMAVGYALSKKIKKEPGQVFCIIGDGESNEGTIWEAAMYGEQLHLDNLVCIVDRNNSQGRAKVSINLKEKFDQFGWRTDEVDGHDVGAVTKAIFASTAAPVAVSSTGGGQSIKPLCVIANTKKGKGIKELEENFVAWHHKAPQLAEYDAFKNEIMNGGVSAPTGTQLA